MAHVPIGPGPRDLTALLEVTGGPDPDRFSQHTHRRARGDGPPRRAREQHHARAEHEPERDAETGQTLQGARPHTANRRSMAARTSAVLIRSMHGRSARL